MSRQLTSRSSLENLKREAKRWLHDIRAGDTEAVSRFRNAHPRPPSTPTLRDAQLALAREYGFDGWSLLKAELERRAAATPQARADAVQALLAAADRGDAEAVRALLAAHPDIVNERAVLPGHSGRRTALHFATNCRSAAVAEALLVQGADPNIRDEGDNALPLHFAAEKGDLAMVRMLVEHGSDTIGAGDEHELEVIGWATCFAAVHRDVAAYLLAHGARHTIFSAVALGDAPAIRAIVARAHGELERPMDRTNRRRRPLHLAVVAGQHESLDTLLELGAMRDTTDAAGLTALDTAALSGDREMAERLLAAGAGITLPAAVALDRRDDVARLLRAYPHSLRPGGRYDRLIIRAAERASGGVIEALVRAGASVHVRDSHHTAVDGTHGYTALHAAAFHGNEDAVHALLRLGANPADREDRYRGSPAGWADYAGHAAARDIILDGAIDIFDAVRFDRPDRVREILARDPEARNRPFGSYLNVDAGEEGAKTPLDVATELGRTEVARILREHAADEREERVARFLRWACQDWRTNGDTRVARMHDAARLLAQDSSLARASFFTAVACGDVEHVRALLASQPSLALAPGGPRGWAPLLYLCSARLPFAAAADNAPEIARLLLDHGADPNVFYLGGNADIHYTAFTCVMGRGEELAATHPRARELVALLLERGADPHDNQVLYNVFANNTSRHLLGDDIVWLLELMHEHSIRRGGQAQWADGTWPMFDMRGAPSLDDDRLVHHGAHLLLEGAVDRNLLGLADWVLRHGADPNTPFGPDGGPRRRSLHQDAVALGHTAMAQLLVRHGARTGDLPDDPGSRFADACMRLDRPLVRDLLAGRPDWLRHPPGLKDAIRHDRADVVAMLLDLGVSPNIGAPSDARPLHFAAAQDARACARVLIDRGAEVDARESGYNGSAITWAAHFGHREMIALLAPYSRDVWHLTYTGQVERLRELLAEAPGLARTADSDGDTPLMWLPDDAAAAFEIARLFLANGADPGRRNADGATAADVATRRGMAEVARLLSA